MEKATGTRRQANRRTGNGSPFTVIDLYFLFIYSQWTGQLIRKDFGSDMKMRQLGRIFSGGHLLLLDVFFSFLCMC